MAFPAILAGSQLVGPLLQGVSGGPVSGAPAAGGGGGIIQQLGAMLGGGIRGLIEGPGRGAARRLSARNAAMSSPGLVRLKQSVQASGATTAAEIATVVRQVVAQDPAAAQALAAVLQRAQSLGGFTSAQGEEANTLGDVLKFAFGLGTVRRPGSVAAQDVVAALMGDTAPVSAPAAPTTRTTMGTGTPASFAGVAPASGQAFSGAAPAIAALTQARDFVAGSELVPSTGGDMGTFLDALGAFAGSAAAGVINPPFVLPGGMPVSGFGGGMVEAVRRNVGVPFVDLTPSGSSELFEPFRLTSGGARPQVHIQVNPVSEKMEFFGPLGPPVLFSRDVAVARRVGRLARRLGTVTGINRGRGRMVRRRRGGR